MINLDNFLAINQKSRVGTSKLSPRGLPTRPPKNSSSLIWLAESKWGFRIGFWKFKSLIFKSLILKLSYNEGSYLEAISEMAFGTARERNSSSSRGCSPRITCEELSNVRKVDHFAKWIVVRQFFWSGRWWLTRLPRKIARWTSRSRGQRQSGLWNEELMLMGFVEKWAQVLGENELPRVDHHLHEFFKLSFNNVTAVTFKI